MTGVDGLSEMAVMVLVHLDKQADWAVRAAGN